MRVISPDRRADIDGLAVRIVAQPWKDVRAVLAQQRADAAGQPRDDAVFPADRGRRVQGRIGDADARAPIRRATCRAFSNSSAAWISAFDGMQPMLRQVPPRRAALDQHGRHCPVGRRGSRRRSRPARRRSPASWSFRSSSLVHEQQRRRFEQARIAWMNAAASMPSTTRWSNDDDRFISLRTTTAPSRTTGRSTIRLTPTIATSGWLMTGVVTMPPSGPRLVIVIVEPRQFLARSLARCAPLRPAGRSRRRTTRGRELRHGGCTGTIRPAVGLGRDAEVDGAVAGDHTGLVVVAGVHLREVARPRCTSARASSGSTVSLPRVVP